MDGTTTRSSRFGFAVKIGTVKSCKNVSSSRRKNSLAFSDFALHKL